MKNIYTFIIIVTFILYTHSLLSQSHIELHANIGISQINNSDDFKLHQQTEYLDYNKTSGLSYGIHFKYILAFDKLNVGLKAGIQMLSHRMNIYQEQESYSWMSREIDIRYRTFGQMLGALLQYNIYKTEKISITPQVSINLFIPTIELIDYRETRVSYLGMNEESFHYRDEEIGIFSNDFIGISNVNFVPSIALIFGFPVENKTINLILEYERYMISKQDQGAPIYNNYSLGVGYVF